MADTNSSPKPANYWKYLFILLLLLIVLGLVGYFSYRAGTSQSQNEKPTPAPEVVLSPTPLLLPSISASPTTATATPTTTLGLTPSPTNTPTPTTASSADLFISEYSFDHPPKQSESFTVKIGLYNKGTKAASPFWWEWWATSAVRPCRAKIDSLVAKGGIIVNCTYTYRGWGTFATKAVIDADNEVAESDEGNNTKTQEVIPIP